MSQRRITSKLMNVRALPMWMLSYTVGPHTYMRTFPASMGWNASFRCVALL